MQKNIDTKTKPLGKVIPEQDTSYQARQTLQHESGTLADEMDTGDLFNNAKDLLVIADPNYINYCMNRNQQNNRYVNNNEKYKLHININRRSIEDHGYISKCMGILMEALASNSIDSFKIYNWSLEFYNTKLKTIKEEKPHNAVSLIENYTRQFNNPITIYLHELSNLRKIAQLCMALEKILIDCPVDITSISGADLLISDHCIFRQETQQGKYIPITGPDDEANRSKQNELYKTGKNSRTFQTLTKQLFILQLFELSERNRSSFCGLWMSPEPSLINKLMRALQGNNISFSSAEYKTLMNSAINKPYRLAIKNILELESHIEIINTKQNTLTREYFITRHI